MNSVRHMRLLTHISVDVAYTRYDWDRRRFAPRIRSIFNMSHLGDTFAETEWRLCDRPTLDGLGSRNDGERDPPSLRRRPWLRLWMGVEYQGWPRDSILD